MSAMRDSNWTPVAPIALTLMSVLTLKRAGEVNVSTPKAVSSADAQKTSNF